MKLNTQFLFAALTAVSIMTPACGGDAGKKTDEKKVESKTEVKTDGSKVETKTEERKVEDTKPAVDPAAPAAATAGTVVAPAATAGSAPAPAAAH